MLNELFDLAKTLEKQGLLPERMHPNIYTPKPCDFRISLDEEGNPCSLRVLGKSEASGLWTHGRANHNRFPAVRVQKPLLAQTVSAEFDASAWDKADLARKRSMLQELAGSTLNPEHTESDRPDLCLKPWSWDALQPVLEDESEDLKPFRLLLLRIPRDRRAAAVLCEALVSYVTENARSYDEKAVDQCKKLLIGSYDAKQGGFRSNSLIYFDIEEDDDLDAVSSKYTKIALSRCLLQASETSHGCGVGATPHDGIGTDVEREQSGIAAAPASQQSVSALSGNSDGLLTEPYPSVALSVLGPTSLFSNNAVIPCLSRYGMEDKQSFPVTEHEAQRMAAALGFLTDKDRENMTWGRLPGAKGDPQLVVAWIDDDPESDARLGAAFGVGEKTHTYETVCKKVIDCLSGKPTANHSKDACTPVHLWVFEKLDPSRRQLVFEQTLTSAQLHDDLVQWVEASENVPPGIHFGVKAMSKAESVAKGRVGATGKGGGVLYCQPLSPSPGALCGLARVQYRTTCGTSHKLHDNKASVFTTQQVYRLLLPSAFGGDQRPFVAWCLAEVVRQCGDLLADAGSCQVTLSVQPFNEEGIRKVRQAAGLLGILLFKLGVRKEFYMNGQAFSVGCLLKQADRLHKRYCIEVRNKGDVNKPLPPQLMGNSVFQIALDNPVEGINRLEEKMRVYLGWAETANSRRAYGVMRDLEAAARALASAGDSLPEQFSPEERAQMLLGYLVGFPEDLPGAENSGETSEQVEKAEDTDSEVNQVEGEDHE